MWLLVFLVVGVAFAAAWVLTGDGGADVTSFDDAVKVVLAHEGTPSNFWVDNPADPGGETAWGISTRIIQREGITAAELGLRDLQYGALRELTVAAATGIYRRLFWDRYGYGRLVDQTVATKVFDASVNLSPPWAHTLAQRAAGELGHPCAVDSVFGAATVAAVNACDPVLFVRTYARLMGERYDSLVAQNPALGEFASNWAARAAWGAT